MSDSPHRSGAPRGVEPAGGGRRFLRAARMAQPVTLGLDGRPREPDDPLSGLVGGSSEETAEAGSIVEAARLHADELVRRAALEASAIRERAHQLGYDAGYREGGQDARVELAEALALVQRVAAEGQAIRNDLLRGSEREMVEMVIAALSAILGERAVGDPSLVVATVQHALARAGAQNVVRVHVHPEQADHVRAAMAEADGDPPPFEVLADGAIGLGGCVVDTAHGRVDARLDVQLDAIAQLLRAALPLALTEEAADAA